MQEIWKDIPNYIGLYQVSNLGNVKSLVSNKNLKQSLNNCGYCKVQLYKDTHSKTFYVHRLVAESFIYNHENKPQVNHIDGSKTNNIYTNLEWVSASDNQLHAIKIGLRESSPMLNKKGSLNPNSKTILQYSLDGTFVKKWGSLAEICLFYSCQRSLIWRCLTGKRKSAKGYIWKYEKPIS